MATADELLAGLGTGDDTTLVIDNYLRTINIPKGITNLGVEHDDEVLILNFKMPRYLDNTDLSKFAIRINYINANGDSDAYTVNDNKKTVGENFIKFSWLVGPTATAYKGTTKFIVCMKTMKIVDGQQVIDKEYNTTVASLPVLEGLEVEDTIVQQYSDIIEQWRQELFGIGDTEEANMRAVSQEEQENIAKKGAEVLATIPKEYKNTVDMAEEGVRTKADAIVGTAEGTSIAVGDSSNDHIRNLRMFGKSTQTSTTGKNLFHITAKTKTINGVTFTIRDDGTVFVSGTATENIFFDLGLFTLPEGEYLLSGCQTGSTKTYLLYFQRSTDSSGYVQVTDGSKTFTISDSDERKMLIAVYAGTSLSKVFYPMIRSSGIADDTYEPYTGGFQSPSSDWPQEFTSIENPSVVIGSKNLLKLTIKSGSVDTGTIRVNPDNSLTLNGTVSKNTAIAIGKFQHNGTFTLSTGVEYDSLLGSYIYVSFNNGMNIGWYGSDKTFTINDSIGTVFIVVVAGTYSNVTIYPMIRLATIDDATYESYQEIQTLPLNRTLRGLAVTYGGDYVDYVDDDGRKWIRDTVDLDRGVYIQKIGVANSTTCSLLNYSLSGITGRGQLIAAPNPPKLQGVYGTLCNVAVRNDTALEAVDGEYYENPANIVLVGAEGEDEATMRERLANFEYLYVLENPIETPLATEEIAAFKALHTNYPHTTVLNDAGAHMELKYNVDTKTYVDNGIQRTVSEVMEAIENGSY